MSTVWDTHNYLQIKNMSYPCHIDTTQIVAFLSTHLPVLSHLIHLCPLWGVKLILRATLHIVRLEVTHSAFTKKLLMVCCHQSQTRQKKKKKNQTWSSGLESRNPFGLAWRSPWKLKRKVCLISLCALSVTNDMPTALFPNIDAARNNMTSFSSEITGTIRSPEGL